MQVSAEKAALASAISKSIRRLLPFLALMYVMAYLDRANIGFAKQAFQADTGLSNAAYAFGAGIFFIGYAIFEIPSNIMLYRVGARMWLSRIMVTWGLISAAMMFAHTETTFYVLRFLLGASEAGFMPGVMLYLTFWFPIEVRAKVAGFFWFGPPVAFILGGPLSGALLSFDNVYGLHDWQLMFLVEGVAAALVGIWAFFYLVNRPTDDRCHWLTAEEKAALSVALESEESEKSDHGPRGAWAALCDPRVIYLCVIAFTIQVASYGMAFFLPSQVAALVGAKIGLLVGVLSGIPWLVAAIAAYYIPHLSTVMNERRVISAVTLCLGGLGVGLSGSLAAFSPTVAFISLCIGCAGLLAVQPIYWTLPTGYLSGAAAASGIALINSLGNLGGFVAPNIRVWAEAAFQSQTAGLQLLGIIGVVGGLMILPVFALGIARRPVQRKGWSPAINAAD
ncbi:Inner membrane transport protein RhmT [Rhodovastum atsumiense]|uniref:MFS transporter n=1 Tax=Rhodovastum atsumiense TaxID=504468 RepID=A0A5M6ILK4_9PROT|nr:MFS transporter [Rhodovastum atsumiense]KAA5609150.1 MFS transporter [Rhodovastum atsumiense]CAH2601239.1 Inner membrane transport protein RhmT [Rhodovastum atsumiense]